MTACIFVALSWFFASAASSAAGVGVVMLSTPVVSLFIPPAQAVLVACLVSSVWVFLQFASYRHSASFKEVLALGIGSLPGCACGALVLKTAPMALLELCVAAMIAIFLVLQAIPRRTTSLPASKGLDLGAGFVAGLTAASVGMDGPPLAIYSLIRGWSPDEARANMSAFFIFTTVGCIASQAAAGLYSMDIAPLIMAGILGALPGHKLGVYLGKHLSYVAFRRLLMGFLFCASCSLAYRGIMDF